MSKELISEDFRQEKVQLEREIVNIEMKQTELQVHISDLEVANSGLKNLIKTEKDPVKKSKYYAAIRSNIELVAKIYSAYKDFESIKFSYRKEISTLTQNKNRIIYIELEKIKAQPPGTEDLTMILKSLVESSKSVKENLLERVSVEEDSKYNL